MPSLHAVPPPPPENEGNTVAAWVCTVGVVLGSIVAALGLVLVDVPIIIGGAIVIVLALIVSLVLRIAGFGQKSRRAQAR
ncbi:hypothetical protein DEO23_11375 [Brachybacterium endophyticum]|uniref:Uncharacterized protein n=1 Tax=Brachybacterium endophyticum TaxID=2182385 RepID=A0A2U2RJ23_9MICO|nr:HGxxPAAW family protein [Brachybacterium endophyticum]PWH05795.1 hypothetical protein DEO23_11375 [Brachybacterium endophyticum]